MSNSSTFPLIQPTVLAGAPPDGPEKRVDPNVSSSLYTGVVSLEIETATGERFLCSGTVISSRHVLTAAHCLDIDMDGKVDPGLKVKVHFNVEGDTSTIILADALDIYPEYQGFFNTLNEDLALVSLSEPVPEGVQIYPIHRDPIAPNEVITFVGYGLSGNGDSGYLDDSDDFTVKRVGQNQVESFDNLPSLLQGFLPEEINEVYLFDFDNTDGSGNFFGLLGSGPSLGNDRESTLAPGDSGSPSFIEKDGLLELAGVNNLVFALPNFEDLDLGGFDLGDLGNLEDLDELGDLGNLGDLGDLLNLGDLLGGFDLGNLSNLSDLGDLGNLGDLLNLGDLGNGFGLGGLDVLDLDSFGLDGFDLFNFGIFLLQATDSIEDGGLNLDDLLSGFELGDFDFGDFDFGGFQPPENFVVQGVFGTGGGGIRLDDPDKLIWIDSFITNDVPLPPPGFPSNQVVTLLQADFSNDGGGASTDGFVIENQGVAPVAGLWNLTERRADNPGHSADHSFYFGTTSGNYQVGHTAGWLTSPMVDLTDLATAELSFNYFLNVEIPKFSDLTNIQVARADGRFETVLAKGGTGLMVDQRSVSEWRSATVDLSDYVGDQIKIRFSFDSVDALFNQFEGWYVDDVLVTGQLALDADPLISGGDEPLVTTDGAIEAPLSTDMPDLTTLLDDLFFVNNVADGGLLDAWTSLLAQSWSLSDAGFLTELF
jgi:hypothetical protein